MRPPRSTSERRVPCAICLMPVAEADYRAGRARMIAGALTCATCATEVDSARAATDAFLAGWTAERATCSGCRRFLAAVEVRAGLAVMRPAGLTCAACVGPLAKAVALLRPPPAAAAAPVQRSASQRFAPPVFQRPAEPAPAPAPPPPAAPAVPRKDSGRRPPVILDNTGAMPAIVVPKEIADAITRERVPKKPPAEPPSPVPQLTGPYPAVLPIPGAAAPPPAKAPPRPPPPEEEDPPPQGLVIDDGEAPKTAIERTLPFGTVMNLPAVKCPRCQKPVAGADVRSGETMVKGRLHCRACYRQIGRD